MSLRRCGLEGKKSKAATLEIDRGEQESPISKNMLFDRGGDQGPISSMTQPARM